MGNAAVIGHAKCVICHILPSLTRLGETHLAFHLVLVKSVNYIDSRLREEIGFVVIRKENVKETCTMTDIFEKRKNVSLSCLCLV